MKKSIFILVMIFILAACSSKNSDDYLTNEDGEEIEIGNPYSSGTGHYAGYEWAEETGGSCTGKSESFNEGCEEYYRQINQKRSRRE